MSDSPDLHDEPGLGLDLPEAALPSVAPQPVAAPKPIAASKPIAAPAYRVLARKYRPQTFGELIGQDAMVTTLGNAIARGRIAHAFLLTGVRGVGKTSTARLVAKALNCIGPDGTGGPTIDPCGVCEPCVAIAEGRHIDVIEMDAASHTGVDDVREIIEAVRYASVSARFKIYIIDEVHMLSKNAFNALLKTLEEPPAHVKFLFATTEVNKVPVTVLSRCQRFDLRRIPAGLLADHFRRVATAEGVEVEDEALKAIARAAEGSARDGLSILDQAIAHGASEEGGKVTAAEVRSMLGLADRGRIARMLDTILKGDAAATLEQLDEAHSLGIEPAALLRGLMEQLHVITRAKAGAAEDALQSVEERDATRSLASTISWGSLHRLWQLLLKGLTDVGIAPDPLEAATMALLRLIHAADLPDPATLLAQLAGGGAVAAPATRAPAQAGPAPTASARPAASSSTASGPADFAAFVAAIERCGKTLLALQLHDNVGLVAFASGEVVLRLLKPLGADFARELAAVAKEATGQPWQIRLVEQGGAPSLHEQEAIAEQRVRAEIMDQPAVRALLDAFPDAIYQSHQRKEA